MGNEGDVLQKKANNKKVKKVLDFFKNKKYIICVNETKLIFIYFIERLEYYVKYRKSV